MLACDVEGSAIFGTPFKPYLVNGIGLSWRADNTDFSAFEHHCHISDQEAISLCHLIARERGILMGGYEGIVVCAALIYLHATNVKSALALIPDTGANYLDHIYDEHWLRLKNIEWLTVPTLLNRIRIRAAKI